MTDLIFINITVSSHLIIEIKGNARLKRGETNCLLVDYPLSDLNVVAHNLVN